MISLSFWRAFDYWKLTPYVLLKCLSNMKLMIANPSKSVLFLASASLKDPSFELMYFMLTWIICISISNLLRKRIWSFEGLKRLKTIIRGYWNNPSTKSYDFPSIVCSEWDSFTGPNRNAIFHRKYFSHFLLESVNGPPLIFGHPRWYFGFFWLSKHRLNGCFRSAPIVHWTDYEKWFSMSILEINL